MASRSSSRCIRSIAFSRRDAASSALNTLVLFVLFVLPLATWLPGPSNFPASLTGLKMIMNGTEMEMVLRMGLGLMMAVAALDG